MTSTSSSPPQSLLFQDNTLSFASRPPQKLDAEGLSMGDSCHIKGMPGGWGGRQTALTQPSVRRHLRVPGPLRASLAPSQTGGLGAESPACWSSRPVCWAALRVLLLLCTELTLASARGLGSGQLFPRGPQTRPLPLFMLPRHLPCTTILGN